MSCRAWNSSQRSGESGKTGKTQRESGKSVADIDVVGTKDEVVVPNLLLVPFVGAVAFARLITYRFC